MSSTSATDVVDAQGSRVTKPALYAFTSVFLDNQQSPFLAQQSLGYGV